MAMVAGVIVMSPPAGTEMGEVMVSVTPVAPMPRLVVVEGERAAVSWSVPVPTRILVGGGRAMPWVVDAYVMV